MLAGTIVFFVALPLCLGIASASGVDPLAGLMSGMIGGLVVALLSGSQLSVSGRRPGWSSSSWTGSPSWAASLRS